LIASLEGILAQRGADSVIVDVHGVGYLVTVGNRTLAELGPVGERVRLYTYTYVREDAGLAILSRAELRVLKRAILQEDAALLATVPGIGPKTAARVVLELKGKLKDEMFGEEARVPAADGVDAIAQALQVLTGLGYAPAEAKEAVRKATAGNGGNHSVEQLVTVALKGLDRG